MEMYIPYLLNFALLKFTNREVIEVKVICFMAK